MTQIETLTRLYIAFVERDIPTIIGIVDPEIMVSQTELLPWGGTYQGLEGLQQFFGKLLTHINSQVEITEFIEAENKVILIGNTRGTVLANGNPFDVRLAHVWTFCDGKAWRFEAHIETEKMLQALGLGVVSRS